uniref:Uncharacterized protein n=1 Tax=Pygocentrus nattereri TaxID=42514 RepID=A0AAR2LI88_PYGNA
METMHEFVPFVKEMLSAGPSKRAMKVYLVGGTFLAILEEYENKASYCHYTALCRQHDRAVSELDITVCFN